MYILWRYERGFVHLTTVKVSYNLIHWGVYISWKYDMLSTSRHHRICEQLTIIEVHMHISALHTLCNLKIHKIHATGRETFCTFHYSRIWVRLLPSLFHVHIFLYVQWLHTSPSPRLRTWVREMVLHLTITQAVYMGQGDGCTPHHHTGCVNASEIWTPTNMEQGPRGGEEGVPVWPRSTHS